MNKNRLLRLADLLENDAANEKGMKFDLKDWGQVHDLDNKVSCSTVGCAIGLALLTPEFQKEGFLSDPYCEETLIPTFDGERKWAAVKSFFDISHETSQFLFAGYTYEVDEGAVAELEVARRIRIIVEQGESDHYPIRTA